MNPGRRRQPRTLAEWLQALEASGWEGKRRGREWSGPCPLCGGEDRFHVAQGSRVAVIASCRHGCTFPQLAEHLFPRPLTARRGQPRAPSPGRLPKARRGPENGSQAVSGRSGGIRAGSEARKSPVTDERDPRRGGSTPGIRPGMEDHAARMNTARRLWERSEAVPIDPEHPARRWAARRQLWPGADPWPDAARWIQCATRWPDGLGRVVTRVVVAIERGGGSLVAAFAPVADWTESHPPASPSGVQLVHVAPDGRPRKDRGGLAKRSHGRMSGAVCVVGGPLWRAGTLHVAEGLADALAIAARCDGPVIAAGGTATLSRLAGPLAALARPVLIHADGDPVGIVAARRLLAALTRRGIAGAVRTHPPGCDPAQPTR